MDSRIPPPDKPEVSADDGNSRARRRGKRPASWFPLLCAMMRYEGRDEHRDMRSTYVLWVLDDGSNVVFLHKDLLNDIVYRGQRFIDWLMVKPPDECCRMVSRTVLASLRYKPAYIVLVGDDDRTGAPYASGYSMATMLRAVEGLPTLPHIQAVAEGGGATRAPGAVVPLAPISNLLGRCIAELCCTLADRGFFSDPANRVRYGRGA